MSIARFFEANAGTGKTSRLMEAIVDAVRKEVPLEKVCALTFTEKAANEMVERLRGKIADLVDEGLMQPGTLEKLNDCFIGTIHGFCTQMLKRYGEKIGLPPLFQIDGEEAFFQELFDARWDSFISHALRTGNPPYLKLIQELGLEALELLADLLAERRYRFAKFGDSDTAWLLSDLLDEKKWDFSKSSRWPEIAYDALKHPDRDLLLLLTESKKLPAKWKNGILDALNCRTEDLHLAIDALQKDFVDPLIREYRGLGYMRYDDLIIDTRDLLRDHTGVRRQLKERYQMVLVDEMQDTDPVQYEIFLYLCEQDGAEERFTLQQLITGQKKLRLQEGKLFVVGDPKQSIYGFRKADLKAYGRIKDVLGSQDVEVEPLLENYRSCPNIVEFTNRLAAQLFESQDSISKRSDFCEGKGIAECIHLVKIESEQADAVHLRVLAEANWLADEIKRICTTDDSSALGSAGVSPALGVAGVPPAAPYKDIAILFRKLTNAHLYIDALVNRGIPVVVEGEKFFYETQEVIDFLNLLKYIVDPMDSIALAGMLRSPLFALTDLQLSQFFAHYNTSSDPIEALRVAQASSPPESQKASGGFVAPTSGRPEHQEGMTKLNDAQGAEIDNVEFLKTKGKLNDVKEGQVDTADFPLLMKEGVRGRLSNDASGHQHTDTLITFLQIIQAIRSDLSLLGPGKLMDRILKSLPVLTVASLAYGSYRSQLAPLNILKIHKHALAADADPVMTPYRFVKTFETYSKEAKESSQEPVADEGSDAVRVMSIHKSKGLDFPIVFVPLTDSMTASWREGVEVVHDWETDQAGVRIKAFTDSTYLRLKYGTAKKEETEPEGGTTESPLLIKEGVRGRLSEDSKSEVSKPDFKILKPLSKKKHEPTDNEKKLAKIADLEGNLAKLDEEERRVLYVAATRAKQQLYFCNVPNPDRDDKALGKDIFAILCALDDRIPLTSAKSTPWFSSIDTESSASLSDLKPVLKEWEVVEASRTRHSTPILSTITTEAQTVVETEEFAVNENAAGIHAALIGSICHAAMEKVDYRNPGSATDLVRSITWKFSDRYTTSDITRAAKESIDILDKFLASDVARWLASCEILGREVPVSVFDASQNKILTGSIDLLLRDGGQLYLIDYKTNLELADADLQIYRTQMQLYASAMLINGITPRSGLCLIRRSQFVWFD